MRRIKRTENLIKSDATHYPEKQCLLNYLATLVTDADVINFRVWSRGGITPALNCYNGIT